MRFPRTTRKVHLLLGVLALSGAATAALLQAANSNFVSTRGTATVSEPQGVLEAYELSAGSPSTDISFEFSGGEGLAFHFFSQGTASLTLISPHGRTVDPRTALEFQEYSLTEEEVARAPIPAPMLVAGTHLSGVLPVPATGRWTARITSGGGAVTGGFHAAAIGSGAYEASSSAGPVRVNAREVAPGQAASVLASVYRVGEPQPVKNLQAVATVSGATGADKVVVLRDDGVAPDMRADDGKYEGYVPSTEPGTYTVSTAFTNDQNAVLGRTTATYTVRPSAGKITGVRDSGVTDEDGDGLSEYFTIDVAVDAQQEGQYEATVYLRGANGREFIAAGEARLQSGLGNIPVQVGMEDIKRTIGQGGPFNMRLASASYLPDRYGAPRPLGVLEDAGQTAAYAFSAFDRPAIQMAGYIGEQGVDSTGNRRYDELVTTFKIDVVKAGGYSWTADLMDQAGNVIATSNSFDTLSSGENSLSLAFNGEVIGRTRVNGPYVLGNFAVYSNDDGLSPVGSLLTESFQTQAYRAAQFEGGLLDLAGLIAYVQEMKFIGGQPQGQGHRRSLLAKLENAKQRVELGDKVPAKNVLEAFMNEVRSQNNKSIAPDDAVLMLESVQEIVSSL